MKLNRQFQMLGNHVAERARFGGDPLHVDARGSRALTVRAHPASLAYSFMRVGYDPYIFKPFRCKSLSS